MVRNRCHEARDEGLFAHLHATGKRLPESAALVGEG